MSAYPAARTIAEKVVHHWRQQSVDGDPQSQSLDGIALGPGVQVIERMVAAAFWASLRREEGRTPLLSLAFVRPEDVPDALLLKYPVKLAPEPLTRMAPAVERPGIHLGISEHQGELTVWGATRALPHRSFVLEVIAPGFLILKQSPAQAAGKFVNIAVVEGDEIKIIGRTAAPDCPPVMKSLLSFDWQYSAATDVNVLVQLAASMRAHGHGGALLVVPADTNTWRESVVIPGYLVSPAYAAIAELVKARDDVRLTRQWQDALSRAVDSIAGLTAVDGAAIITDRYELLAFGAKIVRRPGNALVHRIVLMEPVENSKPELIEPAQLGGTRHLSAAQFTFDQKDSVALVASQDARFTAFAWSFDEQIVYAHRIEMLLF